MRSYYPLITSAFVLSSFIAPIAEGNSRLDRGSVRLSCLVEFASAEKATENFVFEIDFNTLHGKKLSVDGQLIQTYPQQEPGSDLIHQIKVDTANIYISTSVNIRVSGIDLSVVSRETVISRDTYAIEVSTSNTEGAGQCMPLTSPVTDKSTQSTAGNDRKPNG